MFFLTNRFDASSAQNKAVNQAQTDHFLCRSRCTDIIEREGLYFAIFN
jgi:hypothetical protein